jgi:hypothetical protein
MAATHGELTQMSPPDAVYVRQRWIPQRIVDWVEDTDKILVEYGAVRGTVRYSKRSARWHAQKLIRYMVALDLHERWELGEHVERRGDGWLWFVEYRGTNGREKR